jgi:hypothetical protein
LRRRCRSGESEFAANIASATRATEPQWQENRTKSLQPKPRRLQRKAATSRPCAAHPVPTNVALPFTPPRLSIHRTSAALRGEPRQKGCVATEVTTGKPVLAIAAPGADPKADLIGKVPVTMADDIIRCNSGGAGRL